MINNDYGAEIARLLRVDNKPLSFMKEVSNHLSYVFVKSQDDAIKAAFVKHGLETTEQFIKEHCQRIQVIGEPFEHIYYHYGQPDQVRIISMETEVLMSWHEENGNIKMKAEKRYY